MKKSVILRCLADERAVRKRILLLAFFAINRGSAALFYTGKFIAAVRTILTAFAVGVKLKNIFARRAVKLAVIGKGRAAGSDAFFQYQLDFGNKFSGFCSGYFTRRTQGR